MNASARRCSTLIAILAAAMAWPWSIASASNADPDGASIKAFSSARDTQAGKSGRRDQAPGGTLSPTVDEADDDDVADADLFRNLIACTTSDFGLVQDLIPLACPCTSVDRPPSRASRLPSRLRC